LDLTPRVGDKLLAAGTQVPQPTPGLVNGLGDVAAQLCGQPGDQDRVLVVGLVEGQVLAASCPRGLHRLDAHERHRPIRRQLTQHPPAVSGRLTGDGRSRETLRGGTIDSPVQGDTEIPCPTTECSAGQHLRVVVGNHDHLLPVGQIDPDDRVVASSAPAKPLFVDRYDLAVAKLAAHRRKDTDFVGALGDHGFLDLELIRERVAMLPREVDPRVRERLGVWLEGRQSR
jgi:hypothetical protein